MPATHTILSQCNMMYATWHLAGGVFIDLEMGMGCCAIFTVVHDLYLSPHCVLDATHVCGVVLAEQAQGTYGKHEYEPQRVVDVKEVNCSWSLCSHQVGGNSVANL